MDTVLLQILPDNMTIILPVRVQQVQDQIFYLVFLMVVKNIRVVTEIIAIVLLLIIPALDKHIRICSLMLAFISGNVLFDLCSSFPNVNTNVWLDIIMCIVTAGIVYHDIMRMRTI